MWLLKLLPRKIISKKIGRLAFTRFPKWLQPHLNLAFAKYVGANIHETEFPYYDYNSVGDFFIRRLKSSARPISTNFLIHPCDSEIYQNGKISSGTLIQAKGQFFSLEKFIQIADAKDKFEGGYFVTYYLSPKDYHRVHSPIDGYITQIQYCVGDLWPVNQWGIKNIKELYNQNERVYVEIASDHGPVGVVFVGATNVGSIGLSFDKKVFTNWKMDSQNKIYETPIQIRKGEELGLFKMGSTVVVLYNSELIQPFLNNLNIQRHVKVGAALTQS